ncbi:MAG TPA: UDP-N-acetylmuramoyl-tripeptide--D-alanyl-D-alanine ligase, partial [Methylomirabilota bacterium]|nr:UDP-N-acetylmuramoyl-tripeptide--D-alanyl-D-alanine ligase [Methylomirabilota bacterium]
QALGRLAAYYRQQVSIPVVAITGSNGKTTTKEMTAQVLAMRWRVLKSEGSFNNQWGVPLTLLRLSSEHEALVVELGTSGFGEISYLASLVRPTHAVVTSIGPAHLEAFGSLAGVQKAKGELVEALGADGTAVLNADDPLVLALREKVKGQAFTFGRSPEAHVRAFDITRAPGAGLRFTIDLAGERHPVHLAFEGAHNVYNALAAALVGSLLGLEGREIVQGLEAARPQKGRLVWRSAGSIRILDDSYNANPASVRAALETLMAGNSGRALVALGNMEELGAAAQESHREIGRYAGQLGVTALVTVGSLAALAAEAAEGNGCRLVRAVQTVEEAVHCLTDWLQPGDRLLVKGSRIMQMDRIVETLLREPHE